MKIITILLAFALMVGCTPYNREATEEFKLPKELSHCSVYVLSDTIGKHIHVVHCPKAQTTTYQVDGKVTKNITLISE
jgi:hypothetical protein